MLVVELWFAPRFPLLQTPQSLTSSFCHPHGNDFAGGCYCTTVQSSCSSGAPEPAQERSSIRALTSGSLDWRLLSMWSITFKLSQGRLSPALRTQRQVDLSEFGARLIYIASSKLEKAICRNLVSKTQHPPPAQTKQQKSWGWSNGSVVETAYLLFL